MDFDNELADMLCVGEEISVREWRSIKASALKDQQEKMTGIELDKKFDTYEEYCEARSQWWKAIHAIRVACFIQDNVWEKKRASTEKTLDEAYDDIPC